MAPADEFSVSSNRDRGAKNPNACGVPPRHEVQHPATFTEALKAVHRVPDTPSDTNSESGSEAGETPFLVRRKSSTDPYDDSAPVIPEIIRMDGSPLREQSSSEQSPASLKLRSTSTGKRTYVVASNDAELREMLKRSLEREKEKKSPNRREKFRDMVFTRQFSAFDRQNRDAANSPFHGFYVLFWISVAVLIVKMAADNWRKTGSPLGTNEIMKAMFRRDVIVLLLSDGIMCGLTGVSFVIQRLVFLQYIDWDKAGWIVQNVWQTMFIAGVIGLTLLRDWPWTHTVFFVLHGLAMLMKQHSYAFYNGHLSSVYKRRQSLLLTLKQLENVSPAPSPSSTNPQISALSTSHLTLQLSADEYHERRHSLPKSRSADPDDIESISRAIDAAQPLDAEQLHVFERLIKWEVDALADELKGKATDSAQYYPNNLTFLNHYEYIVLPTVVYELQYPRSESINWLYVAEKVCAMVGVIFVMIMISQAGIYPVVMRTVYMKEMGWSTAERFGEFPWMLSDLIFPFMMEYLLAWYLIWETVLNILAELTYFADRSFYDAWWNSVSWDQFARDWNRPVHNFLLRHVYHSSISSMRVNKHTATLITFFLSACIHELVMWCIFKKLRGYLLMLQMFQLPLVRLSRTKWLRDQKTLGNAIFWVGIFTGPSLLCSLYLIL
ncbi:MBOAT family protein [Durotheca rogersii]|uniref:MBOAT family protein n=1 Tax=Durotheca rogersii TaxID=419775 RepID=UPI00221FAD5E|nr:MBOAT family protein [Durotheca rogersii]KAI5860133.1 MBOAT family protein [Durotheca rogersii]